MKILFSARASWQGWVALKFSSNPHRIVRQESLVFSLVGLILGGMTLLTVLSVMNGFQKRFQDNLREISSFHARVHLKTPNLEEAPSLPPELGVQFLFPFTETPVLIQSRWTEAMPALVKGIRSSLLAEDPSFYELLKLREGSWNWRSGDVLLGERLAYVLGAKVGDTLDITSLRSQGFKLNDPTLSEVRVAGIWESAYYELNRYTLFMPLEDSLENLTQLKHLLWGIKVKDPNKLVIWQRTHTLKEGELSTWREENSAFLQALDFEKKAMSTLLGLLFVIVGLNTYYALRENIVRHQKDMAILKSLGACPADCLRIFMREGFLAGLGGGILGTVLGIALSLSLNSILSFLEFSANSLLLWAGEILQTEAPLISLSLSVEGASRLPLAIYWGDTAMIFSAIFGSSLFFSWLATQSLARCKPSQILRYET